MLVAYSVITSVLYFSESITAFFYGRNFSVLFSRFVLDIEKAHNLYIWVSFSILTGLQVSEILSYGVLKNIFKLKMCCIWLIVASSLRIFVMYYILCTEVHNYL